jgi:hypothetical protein
LSKLKGHNSNINQKSRLEFINEYTIEGLGLSCLTPLSTIFMLYLAVSFIGGGNQSTCTRMTTIDLPQEYTIDGDVEIAIPVLQIGLNLIILNCSRFQSCTCTLFIAFSHEPKIKSTTLTLFPRLHQYHPRRIYSLMN